ncbi:MAG: C39 family peptidase [Verrucomicrobiota bacterium]
MKYFLQIFVFLLFASWAGAAGLNRDFGIDLWEDSVLWNDPIQRLTDRLELKSRGESNTTFLSRKYTADDLILGARPYMLQVYTNGKYADRVVIAYANKPDMALELKPSPENLDSPGKIQMELENLFREQIEKDRTAVIAALSDRLGQPQDSGGNSVWKWTGHVMTLAETGESLLLRIEPENRSGAGTTATQKRLSDNIQRGGTGDVLLSGIPAISQGDRNYCVPASWEKYLRYYGIKDINVYDLAKSGGSTISGSYFVPFAAKVSPVLKKRNLEVDFVAGNPSDLNIVRNAISQGLPLIWALDAQNLAQWAQRSMKRKGRLPNDEFEMKGMPAPHALLVVGYNAGFNEIALSDSTELGSNLEVIWINADEAAAAALPNEKEMIVLKKAGSGSSIGGGGSSPSRKVKPLPFKDKKYY